MVLWHCYHCRAFFILISNSFIPMSENKKVNITITCDCSANGKDLNRGSVYALPVDDAKMVVSAGRAVYGGELRKRTAKKAAE